MTHSQTIKLLGRRGMTLALIASAGALALTAAPARAGTLRPWREVRQISVRGSDVLMTGISAPGPADAWALGEIVSPDEVTPLVEHWNGRRWRRAALPARVTRYFSDTALWTTFGAAGPGDLWAFTLNGHYLRLDGTRWTAGALPGGHAADIEAVEVFSRQDVWAFGGRIIGSGYSPKVRPYAARFNGRTWTAVAVPGTGDINAVSAVSGRDIYAVTGLLSSSLGRIGRPLVLHWTGTAWRVLRPQPRIARGATLYTVLAGPGPGLWIGGSTPSGRKTTSAVVERWNGRSWTSASPPAAPPGGDFAVLGLTPDGRSAIWAVGANFGSGYFQLWRHAGGDWSAPVTTPWNLTDLAAAPDTTTTWAVGSVKRYGRYRGVIARHGPVPTGRLDGKANQGG
jgi:hypothetical protein